MNISFLTEESYHPVGRSGDQQVSVVIEGSAVDGHRTRFQRKLQLTHTQHKQQRSEYMTW